MDMSSMAQLSIKDDTQPSVAFLALNIAEVRESILVALRTALKRSGSLRDLSKILLLRLDNEWLECVLKFLGTIAIDSEHLSKLERAWALSPDPLRVTFYRSHIEKINCRSIEATPAWFVKYPKLTGLSFSSDLECKLSVSKVGSDKKGLPILVLIPPRRSSVGYRWDGATGMRQYIDNGDKAAPVEDARQIKEEMIDNVITSWQAYPVERFGGGQTVRIVALRVSGRSPLLQELFELLPHLRQLDWTLPPKRANTVSGDASGTFLTDAFKKLGNLNELSISLAGTQQEIDLISRSCPHLTKFSLTRWMVWQEQTGTSPITWAERLTPFKLLAALSNKIPKLQCVKDRIPVLENVTLWDPISECLSTKTALDFPSLTSVEFTFSYPTGLADDWIKSFSLSAQCWLPIETNFSVYPAYRGDIGDLCNRSWRAWQENYQSHMRISTKESEKEHEILIRKQPAGWKYLGRVDGISYL